MLARSVKMRLASAGKTLYLLCALLLCQLAYAVPLAQLDLNQPVIDQAGVLNASEEQQIGQKIRDWYQSGLMQAAVVIVDNTNGQDIFDYGMTITDKWKLGDKKIDNGLLVLVAIDNHQYHIFTGYGLEGALPDISVKRIERNQLVPAFRRNDYAGGIENTLDAIATQLQADPETRANMISADKHHASDDGAIPLIAAPIAIICFLITALLSIFIGREKSTFVGAILCFIGLLALSGLAFMLVLILSFMFFVFCNVIIGIISSILHGGGGGGPGGFGGGGFTSGGFGGGSFGGGSFGGGGFSGGGGGFGGGGAGGSW